MQFCAPIHNSMHGVVNWVFLDPSGDDLGAIWEPFERHLGLFVKKGVPE